MRVGSSGNNGNASESTGNSYDAFGSAIKQSAPALPEHLDSEAIWHYLLWSGDLEYNFPSIFLKLFGNLQSLRYRRRDAAMQNAGFISDSWFRRKVIAEFGLLRSKLHSQILSTKQGFNHFPEDLKGIAEPLETRSCFRWNSTVPRAVEEQLEFFWSIADAFGLPRDESISDFLRWKMALQLSLCLTAIRRVSWVRPKLIVVEADNYLWGLAASEAGRITGIPVLSFSHGLDCDPWAYDEVFASHVCVWGSWRKQRFQLEAKRNFRCSIVGRVCNPRFLEVETKSIEKVLWVTRPHKLAKCYTPEFSPKDGVYWLQALLKAAEIIGFSLLIKPHPYDDIELYQNILKCSSVSVEVLKMSISDAFDCADAILGEESTGTADAVFTGKPVAVLRRNWGTIPFEELGISILSDSDDIVAWCRAPRVPPAESRREWLHYVFGFEQIQPRSEIFMEYLG